MNALDYLILRYRLWRHTRRAAAWFADPKNHGMTHSDFRYVHYEPDHRTPKPTAPWWAAYPHLAQKKDTNSNG